MQLLLGDSVTAAEGPLVHELFLQRLPIDVRTALASSVAHRSLEEVAELADRIVDTAPLNLSAVTPADTVDSLRAEVKRLADLVSTLSTRSRSPGRRICVLPHLDVVDLRHPRLPHPLLSAGITDVSETEPGTAPLLATSRETTRPVVSGDKRHWPTTKSPILHYRPRHRPTFPHRYRCSSECPPSNTTGT